MIKSRNKSKRALPEINTTALPDIIFMLLFFFMVVTVICKEELNNDIDLPKVDYIQANNMEDNKQLNLSLYSQAEELVLLVNKKQYKIANASPIVKEEIKRLVKLNNEYPDRAILNIDKSINMKNIDLIKRALVENEIYKMDCMSK